MAEILPGKMSTVHSPSFTGIEDAGSDISSKIEVYSLFVEIV